jgi:hypothetical protein
MVVPSDNKTCLPINSAIHERSERLQADLEVVIRSRELTLGVRHHLMDHELLVLLGHARELLGVLHLRDLPTLDLLGETFVGHVHLICCT